MSYLDEIRDYFHSFFADNWEQWAAWLAYVLISAMLTVGVVVLQWTFRLAWAVGWGFFRWCMSVFFRI